MHRHLIGVLGDGHPHRFELCGDVRRGVGLFHGAAHAPFPLRVAQRHEVFSKGTGLSRIVIDEVVFVIGGKAQPGWPDDENGGDHQHHDTNRHEGLRSKDVRTSPPWHVFLVQVAG